MGSAQIYTIRNNEELDTLLTQASSADGATLLIPDLQRPYVWSPSQVILLVDSLLHGWPFGTLLLWSVEDSRLADIPHRQFWRVVDRTEQSDVPGVPEVSASLPARFRMVLDGQQRLQSLVIALGGDGNGFRLTDRQWYDGLDRERPRGRATAHWSFGQLCLDLPAFAKQIEQGLDVRAIDYRDVLAWVVRAPKDGTSTSKQPVNYNYPLQFASQHPGRFIALPRLWKLATTRSQSAFVHLKKLRDEFLPKENVQPEIVARVAEPLADLLTVFEELKASHVGVLELRAFDPARDDAARYADAIVNIFTRLNTAGRTLTTQEITFAWIKAGWGEGPANVPAERAFQTLRTRLAEKGIDATIDEVVQAVAQVWAVLENGGIALGPKDLLRGERVRPMIPGITQRWDRLTLNMIRVAGIVQSLELEYGRHFQSLNAFLLLSHWRMVGEEWVAKSKLSNVARIAAGKALDDIVRRRSERWLAVTSWAGHWRESSGENVARYLKDLSACAASLAEFESVDMVATKLTEQMASWCTTAAPAAESFVRDKLDVERREDVRAYFFPLWIWHRTDAKRRDWSSVHFETLRSKPSLEVDHIAAVALWGKRPVVDPVATPEGIINDLGNTFLLEKNFNIGKSAKPLVDLLDDIHEIGDDEQRRRDFLSVLAIDEVLADPSERSREEIKAAIEKRGSLIREQLADYVRGARELATSDVPDVGGVWECVSEDGSKSYNLLLGLRQTGSIVEGNYVYDDGTPGTLQGKLRDGALYASWREKRQRGDLTFQFASDATPTFTGQWQNKSKKKSGAWSGKWVKPTPQT